MEAPKQFPKPSEILTIQKFVFLLDDFCRQEFKQHLLDTNSLLSHKLIETIEKTLPRFDSHDELCKKVYGNSQKSSRQKFNQLASYTFKLSHYLALNYPAYLRGNVLEIQKLIAVQKLEQAGFLSQSLREIAALTEDYVTLSLVLRFETQQAYLQKTFSAGVKFENALQQAEESERLITELIRTVRQSTTLTREGGQTQQQKETYRKYFEKHSSDERAAVRIFSSYALIYHIYHQYPEEFSTPAVQHMISNLERESNNHCYIILPFLIDIKSNLSFLKMNSVLSTHDEQLVKREVDNMSRHNSQVKFWRTYLNIPELLSITTKTTHYLSLYHYLVHRLDYEKALLPKHREDILKQLSRCEELITRFKNTIYYKNDMVSLKMVYSGLLILSGGVNIKKGIDELEGLLITYQQINFFSSIDSIFVCLMMGYFAQGNYQKCAETYKRYSKITKGKPIYEDNDIEVHAYYYLSQWLNGHRNQYLQKFIQNYSRTLNTPAYRSQEVAIRKLATDFKIEL